MPRRQFWDDPVVWTVGAVITAFFALRQAETVEAAMAGEINLEKPCVVHIDDPWDLVNRCQEWGCTPDELKAAVKATASLMATTLEAYLRSQPQQRKSIMSLADQYRLAAEEARKHAERANSGGVKKDWLKIAAKWSSLAEASDKAERETS